MADQHITLVDRTDDEASAERPTLESAPHPPTPDSHIDILYENQRGWFVFGIPLFSSKALWNLKLDQSPWVDAKYKPSAVNITNAQVPDPSWVWEWKSWYVDMSRDVDEEGWQYSLWFRGAAWHGSHPWFHSFVRRRRWLRKRVKQKLPRKTKQNRERLFGETFSIGTTLARTSTMGPVSLESSQQGASSVEEEIRDVGTLMASLKKSAIDREKIGFITKFIDDGGEELFYLAEQIPPIMSMLIFQNSRRQLLSTLLSTFDAAKEHRDEHKASGEPENETEERRINNLLKAVEAAEGQCKKLEYYSDIRRLEEEGETGMGKEPMSELGEKKSARNGASSGHS
ncbi:hypothetical protein K504DRAFT_423307 [Pleomassaria siparia CBS 279.74]|uniref:Peroxin/Ferlin domain-containing protein n=1 Tax=Pleomassaria siparia CBS 279.74 TaxID=1314801 RepID=A0A6G1KJL1_9PLEO|nr:hypothetical protein K504DRAFT_423307 [Pleomassaria siparia CBS 279.74]